EIVGFDGKEDLAVPNSVSRHEKEREIETKLILSSNIQQWNVAGNFIGVKDVHHGPWEFGYAFGVSRPLGKGTTANRCVFCRDSLTVGLELYGGLGTWNDFTVDGTSQYIAPLVVWTVGHETLIRISPGWGYTDNSVGTLFRVGVSHDIDDVGH